MTEQQHSHDAKPLSANLVSFILIINFIVIGGLILANMPPFRYRPTKKQKLLRHQLQLQGHRCHQP